MLDMLHALDKVLARMVRGHALTEEQARSIYACTREELERREASDQATMPLLPRTRQNGTGGTLV